MRTFCGITTDGMLDYLAAIFRIGHPKDQSQHVSSCKVTTTNLAEKMYVSPAAASSMLKRLEEYNFIQRSNNDGILLTQQGRLAALQIIRRHRLLEVFLMQIMEFTWDQVDSESHRLEHAISTEFEDRMDRLCGYPTHCPHGDPIPTKEGILPDEKLISILALAPGTTGTLARVGITEADVLRYLGDLSLTPGHHITFVEQAPFGGPVTIEVDSLSPSTQGKAATTPPAETRSHVIGQELAEQLFVLEPEPIVSLPQD